MIDFIKIQVLNTDPNILTNNSLLNFTEKVNTNSGEILPTYTKNENKVYKKTAYYKNLKFEIFNDSSIFISGSLHVYFNNGKHNYNDFTQHDFRYIVDELMQKFSLISGNCKLNCLEIGVNVSLQQNVDEVVNNCLMHRKQPFEHKYNSHEGNYKQARHNEYLIKIYNKSKHCKINSNLLRFEIKYTRMRKLNQRGVHNLFELYNADFSVFKIELLNEWQNVLFYDFTLQFHTLTIKEQSRLNQYGNYLFWNGLIGTNSVHKYKYHLQELKKFVNNFSDLIQDKVSGQMDQKINDLINPPISHLIYNEKRECIITGVDITFQKSNSVMLSHTGLYVLYDNDKRLFDEVKNKYLSKKWINSSLPIQIKEIAHNIRSSKCHAINKQYRLYKSNQLNLLTVLS